MLAAIGSMSGFGADAMAQRLSNEFSLAVGTGNYLGDIGGSDVDSRGFVFDLHPQATRISVTGQYGYAIAAGLFVDGAFSYVGLYDDDAFTASGPRRARNLHFRNQVLELAVRGRWVVWDGPNFRSAAETYPSLHVFAGFGGFHHNPQTRLRAEADNSSAWYDLRELRTEGQAEPYGPLALSVATGFGMNWRLGTGWMVGWEASWRWTNTDYLDDVSGAYGNPSEMTELAAQLSSQADLFAIQAADPSWGESELVHFQWNESGAPPRGNPERNDGFGTLQFKLTKLLDGARLPTRGRATQRALRAGKRRARNARKGPGLLQRWKHRNRF